MKIIIENTEFNYNIGVRMLKAKYRTCQFPELTDVWDSIEPLHFGEIHEHFSDIPLMQIAFRCIGLEGMLREINPKLISTETLSKTTSWVQPDGSIREHRFEDTYELYRVGWQSLYAHRDPMSVPLDLRTNLHFVKCADTSTGKAYVIWVNIRDVYRVNNVQEGPSQGGETTVSKLMLEKMVNPIQAIAWTIMTDIPLGGIEYILRQGDCIFVRPYAVCTERVAPRHLTGKEYLELMKGES